MDKIFVTQPDMPELKDLNPFLEEIWKKKILTNSGEIHNQLEKELAEYLGVKYVSLFSNGTLALLAALEVLEIKGKVITTPYSFVATSNTLLYKNIKPVFIDIDEDSFGINPSLIEDKIDSETSAILPVHVYGVPCNIDAIDKIAKKHDLKVIYDAAHAFGVNYKGKGILNSGDLSILSFHATKSFNTFEGGAVISHNPEMKKKLDKFRNFGFESETDISSLGINAKLNELQSAIGLLNLRSYDSKREKRIKIDSEYRNHLKDVKEIKMLETSSLPCHNYAYFPIFINEIRGLTRDKLYNHLRDNGILVRRYFYPLIPEFELYKEQNNNTDMSSLQIASKISKSVICLPMYSELGSLDVEKIAQIIKEFILGFKVSQ